MKAFKKIRQYYCLAKLDEIRDLKNLKLTVVMHARKLSSSPLAKRMFYDRSNQQP